MNEWLKLPQFPLAGGGTQDVYIRCFEIVAVEMADANFKNSTIVLRNGREVATLISPVEVMLLVEECERPAESAHPYPYYCTGEP